MGREPGIKPLIGLPRAERRADYCDLCMVDGGDRTYLLQLSVLMHQITLCLPCLRHLVVLAEAERRTLQAARWRDLERPGG